MTKIALICSEPIRECMAGIGLRYLAMAQHLAPMGFETVLIHPGEPAQTPLGEASAIEVRRLAPHHLRGQIDDCDVAVAQGFCASLLVAQAPDKPTVLDFYDPWLVEHLHYTPTLGLAPFFRDYADWVLQFGRGDFFLCSSEEQRQFYLGFLTAMGRVNPERTARDPDLRGLIAPVPFGVPVTVPTPQQLLADREPGEKRILFGGLYDWYDPWTLLKALEILDRPEWKLILIENPNAATTPQRLMGEVKQWCQERGWLGVSQSKDRVRLMDWVPAARRFDLFREVDLLAAPHQISLETRLSLRTRFLDALAVNCPVLTSEGGAMSRMLAENRAGAVIPSEDSQAMALALKDILDGDRAREFMGGMAQIREKFSWDAALQPLVAFCRNPEIDPTKAAFAFEKLNGNPPFNKPRSGVMGLGRKLRTLVSNQLGPSRRP